MKPCKNGCLLVKCGYMMFFYQQMQSMVCVEDFRTFANEICDVILDCGFTKPLSRLVISDKVDVVQSIALHHVILKTLGELSQFREGLETSRLPEVWSSIVNSYESFFVISESKFTADRKHRNFLLHINMALYMFCRLCSKNFQENQILRERLQCLYKGTKCLHDVFGLS